MDWSQLELNFNFPFLMNNEFNEAFLNGELEIEYKFQARYIHFQFFFKCNQSTYNIFVYWITGSAAGHII